MQARRWEDAAPVHDRPILLFDLDGIAANLLQKWLDHYNRDYNDHLAEPDIDTWDWERLVKPECGRRIYHYLSRPGFFADLEPIPGAVETLGLLSERVELVVVTASPKNALADKVRWVERHLPFVPHHNVVLTYRKDLVRGDFMFDDAPRNLAHFPGTRILMDYPYNRDFHDAHRVRDWGEFLTLMETFLGERSR